MSLVPADCAIIVLNYRGPQETLTCLEGLATL